MVDLSGKVAVITGAASGIGLAGVEVFTAAGAKVVAGDIQDEKGKALEARFGDDTVSYVHCDVTQMDDLKNMMQHAADHFGGLDILWNNAGSGGTPTGVEDLDLEGYDFTMDLLLKQVFAATHFAVPHMKARGGGSVINTSSISAVCAGYAPITYAVAKKGVAYFSKLAAAELTRQGIRVNAILPGFIATSIFGASLGMEREQADQIAEMLAQTGGPMQPAGRTGKGEDIANMAAYLASDAASFVTGQEFVDRWRHHCGPAAQLATAGNRHGRSPILKALGITPEQAEDMRAAMAGGKPD